MREKNKNKIKKFLSDISTIRSNCNNAIGYWEEKDKKERLIRENLTKLRSQADQMYKTYSGIQSNKIYEGDPSIIDNINEFRSEIDGVIKSSKNFYEDSKNLSKKIDYLTSATSSSVVNMGTGIAFTDTYFNQHREEKPFKPIINIWEKRGPVIEKEILLNKLEKIDSKLGDFFSRIWDSLLFQGITRGEILPAHSMREFMSDFLQVTDPMNLVESMGWCEFSKGSEIPTQRSRVIFAILENLDKFDWKKVKYRSYIEIANKYRDLYIKLNKYAHYRDRNLTTDIRFKLETYIKLLQNYTNEIINLRESQYSDEIPTKWDFIYSSLTDGAIINIRFNCVNCNRELIFYSYELPSPYMGGDKHIDSYRYGERDSIECFNCSHIYEIDSYNSIPGWMISFEGENVPEFFKYRILQHFYI